MRKALNLSLFLIVAGFLFSCSTNHLASKRYGKIQKIATNADKQESIKPLTVDAFEEVNITKEQPEKIKPNKREKNTSVNITPEMKEQGTAATDNKIAQAPKVKSTPTDEITVDKLEEFFANQKLDMERPLGRSRWEYAITSISAAFISGLMFLVAILANFTIGAVFGTALAAIAIIFGALGVARKWKQSRIIAIIGLALGALLFVAWIVVIALYAAGMIL